MSAIELKVYATIGLVVFFIFSFVAIWFSVVLLKEAQLTRKSARNIQTAFGFITIEINKKLEGNNAIHFLDIVRIVDKLAAYMPAVKVDMEKNIERGQLNIVMESGEFKATYTLLMTIVEFPFTPKAA